MPPGQSYSRFEIEDTTELMKRTAGQAENDASAEGERIQSMDLSFSAKLAAESSPVRVPTSRPFASKNSVVGSPR